MDTILKPTHLINNKHYFNLKEATVVIKRSVTTLRREIGRKRIRYLNYGREKYFLQEWLDEYIDKLTVQPRKSMV